MAGKIPKVVIYALNRADWKKEPLSHMPRRGPFFKDGVPLPEPEGTCWLGNIQAENAQINQYSKLLKEPPAGIENIPTMEGIWVKLDQLPALAENGVYFAKEALANPKLESVIPASWSRAQRRDR